MLTMYISFGPHLKIILNYFCKVRIIGITLRIQLIVGSQQASKKVSNSSTTLFHIFLRIFQYLTPSICYIFMKLLQLASNVSVFHTLVVSDTRTTKLASSFSVWLHEVSYDDCYISHSQSQKAINFFLQQKVLISLCFLLQSY